MTAELRLTFSGKCGDRGGTAPVGRDSSEARHAKAPASFASSDPAIWQGLTPQGFRVEVLDHVALIMDNATTHFTALQLFIGPISTGTMLLLAGDNRSVACSSGKQVQGKADASGRGSTLFPRLKRTALDRASGEPF